jgi:NADH:ubiquinone oxidoreductase subunit 5 (subunit L)/multisubunit Na+/H+ antiporter MnhA subunit
VGAVTAFFAATSGAFQNDSKRVIAYPTRSQSGYTVPACGISSHSVTMFHLMNHAFPKASPSLSAGSIIHAMHDEQDMRKMGALNRIPPLTYTMTPTGPSALIGFPSLTGYYSKDFILEVACSKSHSSGNLAYWLGAVSASFTTFHSYRLVFLTLSNSSRSFKQYILHAHDASATAAAPPIPLAFGSPFIGYLTKDMIIGSGSSSRGQSSSILSENVSFAEAEYLPLHIKLMPFIFSHIGIPSAYHTTFFCSAYAASASASSSYGPFEQQSFQKNLVLHGLTTTQGVIRLHTFLNQKWHVDDFYNRFLVQKVIPLGYNISFRISDAGRIAYLGPIGVSNAVQWLARRLSQLQTGFVYHHAFITSVAATPFITPLPSWKMIPFRGHSALYFISILTFPYLSASTR